MNAQLNIMEGAFAGMFDHAGMFPPAELNLREAVQAYREYQQGGHAFALQCMVVRAKDLDVLESALHENVRDLQLSVVAAGDDLDAVWKHLDREMPIKMFEMKATEPSQVARLKKMLPAGMEAYVELPMDLQDMQLADTVTEVGLHAKLRMGGVVAETFPSIAIVASMLRDLFKRGLAFKATAGLHHAVRGRYPFTYREDSARGMMHGFMNLLSAATLVWFGGEKDEVVEKLEEEGLLAWRVTEHSIRWRDWD